MIQVSKEEAMEIRKRFKGSAVYKTMKQANHHKYWTEETRDILAFLNQHRAKNVVAHFE